MRLLVKLGGTLLETAECRASLAHQLAGLQAGGHQALVVHGGGKRLSAYLAGLDHESEFRDGLRVTPPEIMDAVLRVLAGSVNRQLVADLQRAGLRAVGLTGIDAGTAVATQLSPDLGLVGRIDHVDPALLLTLLEERYLPVVACVAGGADGAIFNVNADQMAVALAVGLRVRQLVFLTDVGGVLDEDGRVLPTLDVREATALVDSGVARKGMKAKLTAAMDAVRVGIDSVAIVNGHRPDVIADAVQGRGGGTSLVT